MEEAQIPSSEINWGRGRMDRPDEYVCLKCGHKFQEAEYKQFEDDDGLFKLHPTCPKCGSAEITLKQWVKEKKQE